MVRYWAAVVLGLALLLQCASALAASETQDVYESTQEAMDALEQEVSPETAEETATDVLTQFFPDIEEDEGTYPPSEFVEHGFLLRRQGPAKGSYSGRFFAKYSNDKISGVEKWEKELELYLGYKDVSSYMRFSDVNAFAYQNDPMRWEKGNIRFKHDSGTLTGGSLGAVFGRGLTVNMFEDRFLEFDNEIEGVKIEQEVGKTELTGLWGTRKLRNEFRASEIKALRAQYPVNGDLDIGADYAEVRTTSAQSTAEQIVGLEYQITGADVTWRPGDLRLFGEVAGLERGANSNASGPDLDGEDGLGYYLNGVYSVPGFSIGAEYKDYKFMGHPFNVLPPIRRYVEKSTADPNDDLGYGFDMNWSPSGDGALINVHYVQDNSHQGNRPYTELLSSYSSPTGVPTTWIIEKWDVQSQGEKHDYHRLTLNHIINEDWSASGLIEKERRSFGFKPAFNDYIFEAELAYQSKLNLIYNFEMTGDDNSPQNEWKLFEMRIAPDQDQEWHLLYGSRREGFVCSGGICRQEPAFSGFRIDYLLRF
jgi:hypothetical protein